MGRVVADLVSAPEFYKRLVDGLKVETAEINRHFILFSLSILTLFTVNGGSQKGWLPKGLASKRDAPQSGARGGLDPDLTEVTVHFLKKLKFFLRRTKF